MNLDVITEESGYSLVESIIALALLATVLVPLSNFVINLATHRMGKQKIEAFTVAQAVMEQALQAQLYQDKTVLLDNEKWLVVESYDTQDNLVFIEVNVSRFNRSRPQITLRTVRLLPAVVGLN